MPRDPLQGDARARRTWGLSLILLVLLAAPIRLAGLTRDFPYILDGDEQVYVGAALRILLTGTDSGPSFHPACTLTYPLALVYRVEEALGTWTGRWADRKGFLDTAARDPRWLFVPGRVLSAVAGLASLPLVAMLGRALGLSRVASLLSAALLVLSRASWDASGAVRLDLLETLFMLCAILLATRSLERPGRSDLLGAGLAAGLAGATRWTGLVVWVCVPVAILLRFSRETRGAMDRGRGVVAAGLLFLGGVLVCLATIAASTGELQAPAGAFTTDGGLRARGQNYLCALLSLAGLGGIGMGAAVIRGGRVGRALIAFLSDGGLWASIAGLMLGLLIPTMQVLMRARLLADSLLLGSMRFSLTGDGEPGLGNLLWYARAVLATDVGLPACVMALAGAGIWASRRERRTMPLLAFSASHLALFVLAPMRYARYLIPILPSIALAAGAAADTLYGEARAAGGPGARESDDAGVGGAERDGDARGPRSMRGPVPVAWLSLLAVALGAAAWPIAHAVREVALPDTRVLATEWLQSNIPFGKTVAVESNSAIPCTSCYHVLTPGTLIQLTGRPDVVVTSGWVYGHFLDDPTRYAAQRSAYAAILASYRSVARFDAADGRARGPVVQIYGRLR